MAEKKILVDLNLNKNELKQVVLENQGLAPTSPKDGQIYYHTETGAKGVKYYKTNAWKKLLDEDDLSGKQDTITGAATTIVSDDLTANRVLVSNSSGKVAVSTTTSTELGYVHGVTSAIQTQLDNKVPKPATALTSATKCKITYDTNGLVTAGADLQASDIPDLASSKITAMTGYSKPSTTSAIEATDSLNTAIGKLEKGLDGKQATITGGATTIVSDNLTASKALVSDANGKVAVSSITSTELGYLSGVTSSIQSQLDALEGRGRFLSQWDSSTGLPATNPSTLPYTYKTGDYYIVGTIASANATNYKPVGSSYTGTASTTVETNTVAVNDTYYYDGTNWVLQKNTTAEVTFASITGQPTDNTNLASALNLKADLASPALTGTPTAPTATTGTNTTQIATTAFVQDAISNASLTLAANNTALTQSGGVCTWTITNTLNNADVICSVREVSTGEEVGVNITYTASTITIKINSSTNIAAGTYRAVIIGQKVASA